MSVATIIVARSDLPVGTVDEAECYFIEEGAIGLPPEDGTGKGRTTFFRSHKGIALGSVPAIQIDDQSLTISRLANPSQVQLSSAIANEDTELLVAQNSFTFCIEEHCVFERYDGSTSRPDWVFRTCLHRNHAPVRSFRNPHPGSCDAQRDFVRQFSDVEAIRGRSNALMANQYTQAYCRI